MSDVYYDPILAEDFDPNGPVPDVDYSKFCCLGDSLTNKQLIKNVKILERNVFRVAYNEAIQQGVTEEVAKESAREAVLAKREK